MTPEARFDELLETARADESILGLILYGSRAAGMFVREDSDWDVWLIVRVGAFADYEERYDSDHGDAVEIGTDTVEGLRAHGEPGTSHAWNRYAFRHAQVLVDKLDGEIERDRRQQASAARGCRSLRSPRRHSTPTSTAPIGRSKAHRLGEVIGAHLDAADAASHLLDALFALRGRVRPWSKYLRWELELEPLAEGPRWRADVFLERLESLLHEPSPAHQQQLFRDIEEVARSSGHGSVMDSWGPSLALLRGTIDAASLGGEALGEKPRAVERRELLIPTDGIAVDHHERHGPLSAEIPHASDGMPDRHRATPLRSRGRARRAAPWRGCRNHTTASYRGRFWAPGTINACKRRLFRRAPAGDPTWLPNNAIGDEQSAGR